MLQLPDDIIIAVAICVKRQNTTNIDLITFMLVCKRWHQLGRLIVYGNIALVNTNLMSFADSFNASAYGKGVRSLTLRINKDRGTHPDDLALFPASAFHISQNLPGFGFSGFPSANDPPSIESMLPERLASIIPIISQNFRNLVSFSLRLEESGHRSIPRATIVGFLDALPKSCEHLELDTRGQDHRQEYEHVHICDAMRRILPQLRNVRIRLGAMCCAMFGSGQVSGVLSETDGEKYDGDRDFEPIALPKLKSLIMNCGLPSGLQMQRCGQKDHTTSAKQPSWVLGLAWPSVIEALVNLVKTHADNVKDAMICTILGTGSAYNVQACQTEIRIDLRAKETFAFPSMVLGQPFGPAKSYLLRLHDGSEVAMRRMEDIEEVVEGLVWRDVAGNARLPAEVLEAEHSGLPSFATGCVEQPLPIQSFEEWRKDHPTEPLSIQCHNEKKTGKKLVLAEKRTGEAYLDVRTVKEITPEGWRRTPHSILEPV